MTSTTRNISRDASLLTASFFAAILAIFYIGYIDLSIHQQLLVAGGGVGLLYLIKWSVFLPPEYQRLLLIIFSLCLSSRYWFFRTFDTLYYTGPFDFLIMILLYLAETYSIVIFVSGIFVNVSPLKREIKPIDLDQNDLPTVDLFIPTYNEQVEIVEITATACTQIRYPRDRINIYILDDGGTLEKRRSSDPVKAARAKDRYERLNRLAKNLGIRYLTRKDNALAKAGNISEALRMTAASQAGQDLIGQFSENTTPLPGPGELILLLDCDHIPTTDILMNTVGYFLRDEKLFLVQTPHFFINPDPLEKNLGTHTENPGENEMFYGAVQLGMDFWNSSFFCGSAALLRRKCLDEVGGIAAETITEDAETSMLLHAKGYNSVYVDKPMVCGLSPETLDDFLLQRRRWTQGMIQIFLLKNPLVIKGLKFYQRISYFNSCVFWFFGLARFIFLIAPLAYLFFGLRVYNAALSQIVAYAIPHLMGVVILSDYLYGRVRHPFFSELYESMQSIFLLPAIIDTMLRPRSPSFQVTPKGKKLEDDYLSPLSVPFYLLLMLNLAAVPVAVFRWIYMPLSRDTVIVCSFWVVFNLVLTLLCLGIVWERRQVRKQHRISINEDVDLAVNDSVTLIKGRMEDISLTGFRFIIEDKAEVNTGDTVNIHTLDTSGSPLLIPAQVVRAKGDETRIFLGCEFDLRDKKTLRDVVHFVYGDSNRWQRFWDARREHRVNVAAGFVYLLCKGIDGTVRNFRGLTGLALFYIKKTGTSLWNHCKWCRRKEKVMA